jgi:hypothetical protein
MPFTLNLEEDLLAAVGVWAEAVDWLVESSSGVLRALARLLVEERIVLSVCSSDRALVTVRLVALASSSERSLSALRFLPAEGVGQ